MINRFWIENQSPFSLILTLENLMDLIGNVIIGLAFWERIFIELWDIPVNPSYFLHPFFYRSIDLSICLSMYFSQFISITYLSIYLSSYLSINFMKLISKYSAITSRGFICISVCICLSIHHLSNILSFFLSLSLPTHTHTHIYIYIYIYIYLLSISIFFPFLYFFHV